MPIQIDCYLSFDGNAEEALNFYAQALGGKVSALMRFEGSPADRDLPPGWKNKVLHGTVEAEGAQIMASDRPPSMGGVPGYNGITVSLWIKEDAEKARKAFDALAAGGQVVMPFAPPFWGGHFGVLKDKFGVPWMVSSE
jgi:PhnB protein